MKMILRKRIEKLGDMGDIVTVSSGYARNYLIPNKLAFESSPDAVRQVDTLKRRRAELEARRIEEAKKVAAEMAGKKVSLRAKADGQKLYGAVHAREIAAAITEQLKYEVSDKMVHLEAPIKEVGEYGVKLVLDKDAEAIVTVVVEAEQAPKPEGYEEEVKEVKEVKDTAEVKETKEDKEGKETKKVKEKKVKEPKESKQPKEPKKAKEKVKKEEEK